MTSDFEKETYAHVQQTLKEAMSGMGLDEKILISIVLNAYDSKFHESQFIKVKPLYKLKKYNFRL